MAIRTYLQPVASLCPRKANGRHIRAMLASHQKIPNSLCHNYIVIYCEFVELWEYKESVTIAIPPLLPPSMTLQCFSPSKKIAPDQLCPIFEAIELFQSLLLKLSMLVTLTS